MTTAASTPLRVVVLISGSGTNLQAIIDAQQRGAIPIDIKAVISNRPGAGGLHRAQRAGLPALVLDHTTFTSRDAFDQQLQEKTDAFAPDLIVLAGFMRILTPQFVQHYAGRLLNIHPSLLPKFQGLNTHQRALDAGEKVHGASVHFVTTELDGGPVVAQARLMIQNGETAIALATRVHELEHALYPQVIGWFACGRLKCQNDRVFLDGQRLSSPQLI